MTRLACCLVRMYAAIAAMNNGTHRDVIKLDNLLANTEAITCLQDGLLFATSGTQATNSKCAYFWCWPYILSPA